MDYNKSFSLIKNVQKSKVEKFISWFFKMQWYFMGFLLLMLIVLYNFDVEDELDKLGNFNYIFFFLIILNFVILYTIKFRNAFSYEQVTYDSDGRCFFNEKYIQINDEVYNIEDIIRLEITNYDIPGRQQGSVYELDAAWSSGTNNFITIYFENWQFVKKQFVLISESQFHKVQTELICYLKRGVLTEHEVLSLLRIQDYDEIQIFRRMVQD